MGFSRVRSPITTDRSSSIRRISEADPTFRKEHIRSCLSHRQLREVVYIYLHQHGFIRVFIIGLLLVVALEIPSIYVLLFG